MALPTTPTMQDFTARLIAKHMREDEDTIRALLGQWVSEIEPTIIYVYDVWPKIKGVGFKDDPLGRVIVPNPKYRPPEFIHDGIAAMMARPDRTLLRAH